MALVITIIVLLILAGISINMLTGDNSIINRALEAKDSTEIASIIEQVRLDILAKQTENLGELTSNDLRDVLKEYFTDVPDKLPENAMELRKLELTSQEGGHKIAVGDIWSGTLSGALGTAETNPYMPSDDFTQVPGTNLDTGLVIEDSTGNQYVWIEVPRTSEVYPTAGTEIKEGLGGEFTEAEYETIENDLHTYVSDYNNLDYYMDEYYQDDTTGLTEEEYYDLKQTMLKSVYQNGGFWVGRYEAGISTWRDSHTTINESSEIPLSKENQYPYTYISCSEAQTLASRVNSGNYTSSLMFGVQWDLIIKYLETKGVTKAELSSDSTNWGNYYNSAFTLQRGKYATFGSGVSISNEWHDFNENLDGLVSNGEKLATNNEFDAILLTTGATDTNQKQNIYDLAGNAQEITLEFCNPTVSGVKNSICVRGGEIRALVDYASGHYQFAATSNAMGYNSYTSFRVSIF